MKLKILLVCLKNCNVFYLLNSHLFITTSLNVHNIINNSFPEDNLKKQNPQGFLHFQKISFPQLFYSACFINHQQYVKDPIQKPGLFLE